MAIDRNEFPIEVQKLTADALAAFLRDRRSVGLSSWTRKGMLTPVSRVLSLAVRRGYMSANPLRLLQPEELPKGRAKDDPRVLDRDEIGRLLAATPELYRPALATKVFSGLRAMELLGLCWWCVDFDEGVIRVRHQLTRGSRKDPPTLVELKTRGARRDVVLLPELSELLREHRREAFGRGFARQADYVFTTSLGTPLGYRNLAQRGLNEGGGASRSRRSRAKPDPPRSAAHVRFAPSSTRRRRCHRVAANGARTSEHHAGRLLPRVRCSSAP